MPAGKVQEFDFKEFNIYTSSIGWRGYSTKWLRKCLGFLEQTGLVKILRQYKGHGFKIIARHPWQLDDYQPNKSTKNKSSDSGNKSSRNEHKSSQKRASNSDSTVPINREFREKTNNTERPIVADLKNNQNKADKSERTKINTKPKPKPSKSKINLNVKDNAKPDRKEKSSGKVEQKLNKKQELLIQQIEDQGIPVNGTIVNLVKTNRAETIEKAIAYYKERKRDNYIANPGGYFVQCLKENWAEKTTQASFDQIEPEDKRAVFLKWYDLAKELGYCTQEEIKDNEQWVLITGTWEKWESAYKRGYSIEYLLKTKKKFESS